MVPTFAGETPLVLTLVAKALSPSSKRWVRAWVRDGSGLCLGLHSLPFLLSLILHLILPLILLLLPPRHGPFEGALQLHLRVVFGLHPEISQHATN